MNQRRALLVPMIARQRLTDEASEKQTFHLELDLTGTGIVYSVGDCLAVMPHNPPQLVATILDHFSPPSQTTIQTRTGEQLSAEIFLTTHANLLLPPRALTLRYGEALYLSHLLPSIDMPFEEFCHHLAVLIPRFYSIASSMREVGERAHLTVTLNRNPNNHPLDYGTCSDFLCHRAPLHQPMIAIAHHPARKFGLLPQSDTRPIIMIGPGTGVAPFRGFMQERVRRGASAKNWLFFGEQTEKGHYYYRHEWEAYQTMGALHLDLAFSRDTPSKIYVQHRMLEKQAELWHWLHNEEGYLFVCGDATRMAKAVDQTLHDIVRLAGGLTPEQAKLYIKNLKSQGRYLRDVY